MTKMKALINWYLVAICSDDQIVYVLHKESLESAIFLSLDILQVICVDHSNDMIKFVGPTLSMMIPV